MKFVIIPIVLTIMGNVAVDVTRPVQVDESSKLDTVQLPTPIKANLASVREDIATSASIPQKTQPVAPQASSGNCSDMMSQAGISHPLARELISRESGCESTAVNPSSGACGIAQELLEPHQSGEQWAAVNAGYCPKSMCTMQQPVCQLKWMQSYVYGRYGSWEGAIAHHNMYNWY